MNSIRLFFFDHRMIIGIKIAFSLLCSGFRPIFNNITNGNQLGIVIFKNASDVVRTNDATSDNTYTVILHDDISPYLLNLQAVDGRNPLHLLLFIVTQTEKKCNTNCEIFI